MSYSFIKFNDELVDSRNMMELTDLARLLFKNSDLTVNVRKHSYYNPLNNTLNLGMFWKHRSDISELEGFKHDIYTHFMAPVILDYSAYDDVRIKSSLQVQLFLSLEYYRLRKCASEERPVLKNLMKEGDRLLRDEYSKKVENTADRILRHMNSKILDYESEFEYDGFVFNINSDSTIQSLEIAEDLHIQLLRHFNLEKDRVNPIHDISFSDISEYNNMTDFRKDPSPLSGEEDKTDEEDKSAVETKTSGAAKDATVLGEIGDALNAEESESKVINMYDDETDTYNEGFGKNTGRNDFKDSSPTNRHAVIEIIRPKINLKNYQKYSRLYEQYAGITKNVIGDIQQLLNFKRNNVRKYQASGRLMKNPVMPLIEGSHKLFMKEDAQSAEIDAVFTLVIDQSFSMESHLEEVTAGVIVFNHILKSLSIKHRVISHHEDTFEVSRNNFPSKLYEHLAVDKSNYYYPVSILDIETSGDNRDGFILKHEISILNQRSESDKFIIMFSDGLPSAENYNQSGIVDTHEAVNIAKRENIHVINVFISSESDEQTRDSIQNIYGNNTIIVAHAHEIPEAVANVLNRILLSLLN